MGVHSMKLKRLFAVVIAMLLVLAGCSNSNDNNESKKDDADNGKKQEIQVAAAASLTDVTKKLASEFKKSIKMLILNLTMVDQGIKKTN